MAFAATVRTRVARTGLGGLGLGIGLALLAAPIAAAEPENTPADPPAPLAAVSVLPGESAPSAASATAALAASPASAAAAAVPASGAVAAAPAEGVPHLPTPDNLPPGTTQAPSEGSKLGYIRDLWHAVRTQDVTMSDALLLFTQRPMDADTPLTAMSPRSAPTTESDPAAPPAADVTVLAEVPAPPVS